MVGGERLDNVESLINRQNRKIEVLLRCHVQNVLECLAEEPLTFLVQSFENERYEPYLPHRVRRKGSTLGSLRQFRRIPFHELERRQLLFYPVFRNVNLTRSDIADRSSFLVTENYVEIDLLGRRMNCGVGIAGLT